MDLYPHHLATWPRARLETAIKRRTQIAYLGNGLVLARCLGRHKIFLQASDRGFACNVMLDGYWEIWLTQLLAQRVRPGMTVVDVGANFGYYTLLLADAVGADGRVIAVEPNPTALALLRETVLLNGYADRTTIVSQALSGQEGQALLFCPDGEPKNAQLVGHRGYPGGTTVEVATVTLDSITRDCARVDLIKIDAEGAETAIVNGMAELIARDRPTIILEFNAARYADPAAFLDSLTMRYAQAEEITLNGEILPVDRESVIDKAPRRDRLLLFSA
ncbi:FkbM family methyltransferase [Reyranella sp.]|uniref:FkbM family methyltransferase n=1 Tax=Reyranella sp. TaxID=1929291 RepID=UPI003BA94CF4